MSITPSPSKTERAGHTPGLKGYVTWAIGGEATGTHLQGEIECAYADLVAVFGRPTAKHDANKVDAEWVLTFTLFGSSHQVATIYNYKTGKNYLGPDGLPTEEITDWHIGGKHSDVVGYVASMLIAHYRAIIKKATQTP